MKKVIVLVGFVCSLFLSSAQVSHHEFNQMLSEINADSIRATVQDMVDIPNRFAATSNLEVAQYIAGRMRQYGLTDVIIDSFPINEYTWLLHDYVNHNLYNVRGRLPGVTISDSIVIMGAHHDCITTNPPFYNVMYENTAGADDNASGCAVMLEVLRVLQSHGFSPDYTIDFMTYDGEEFGLWGSEYDAATRHDAGDKVIVMLNNDMVANDPDDERVVTLHWYDNAIEDRDTAVSFCQKYTELTPFVPMGADNDERQASDSWSYAQNGFRSVFAIENNFSPAYHEPGDTTGLYNYDYAAEISKLNLAMLIHYTTVAGVPTKVEDVADIATVSVWPNPTSGIVHISCPKATEGGTTILVYDVFGKLCRTEMVNDAFTTLDISNLPAGMYVMKLMRQNQLLDVCKMMKQ